MNAFQPKRHVGNGPEFYIQQDIIRMMEARGWLVLVTHGNMYQVGLPDLFCCHKSYGQRWVEVKNPKAYHFTKAQLITFPLMCDNGSGVWVLIAATDAEYQKLSRAPNWHNYIMKGSV